MANLNTHNFEQFVFPVKNLLPGISTEEGDSSEQDGVVDASSEAETSSNSLLSVPDLSTIRVHPQFRLKSDKLLVHLIGHGKAVYRKTGDITILTDKVQLENLRYGDPPFSKSEISNIIGRIATQVKNETTQHKQSQSSLVLTADDWIKRDFHVEEADVIIGSRENPIVRRGTKNFIEAPEKSFKTTAMLRWGAGASKGISVFSQLPVTRPLKILHLHGELSPAEIRERTIAAVQGELSDGKPFDNFVQGRDLRAHFITEKGQEVVWDLIKQYRPDVFVADPWQSLIWGFDENSFKDMSAATHFLDELIEEFNVTLLIPIHLGKDHTRGARGHSSLAGWRDTRFQLEPNPTNLTVKVRVEPRWAKPPELFVLRFKDGTVWSDEAFSDQAMKIRRYVQDHGSRVKREDLASVLSLQGASLRQAISRAKDAGAIDTDGDEVILPTAG